MSSESLVAKIKNAYWWHRFPPFYHLKYLLMGWGIGYVSLPGSDPALWDCALAHVPLAYRILGRSFAVAELDASLPNFSHWQKLRSQLEAGDRIYPFMINPNTLAMRIGVVVARKDRAIGGLILISS